MWRGQWRVGECWCGGSGGGGGERSLAYGVLFNTNSRKGVTHEVSVEVTY